MERREALKYAAFFCASVLTVTGASVVPVSCTSNRKGEADELNAADEVLIDGLAAVLIPASDVPGAEELKLGGFVVMMLQDCYAPEERAAFKKVLRSINGWAVDKSSKSFAELSLAQREKVLKKLEKEEPKFMQLLERLVNTGYYTSEIGAKQALRYVFVPGSYKSCIPLEEGQRAWAM